MIRIFLALALISLSSLAAAGIQEEGCFGEPATNPVDNGDWIWQGSFRRFSSPVSNPSWEYGYDYIRGLGDGPIGQCGGDGNGCGDASTPGQICWSLSPFTVTDTDNGETCVNEGPLDFTTSTAYYRMQIDRTTIEPRYCQIAMVTDPAVPGVGDTYVVALADENDSGTPTSVPTMPIYLLMVLSGLLALFGSSRVRA